VEHVDARTTAIVLTINGDSPWAARWTRWTSRDGDAPVNWRATLKAIGDAIGNLAPVRGRQRGSARRSRVGADAGVSPNSVRFVARPVVLSGLALTAIVRAFR
jgi:hypothetical protein